MTIYPRRLVPLASVALLAAAVTACGSSDGDALPQLTQAQAAPLQGSCPDLASRISFANTAITAATSVAAGTLTIAGTPVPAHCQVTGKMYQRVSEAQVGE